MVRKTMESPEVTLSSTFFKVENQSEEEMSPSYMVFKTLIHPSTQREEKLSPLRETFELGMGGTCL